MGEPVRRGIVHPPKGIKLETPAEMARMTPAINIQSVLSHAMPPNNITDMTLDERRALPACVAQK